MKSVVPVKEVMMNMLKVENETANDIVTAECKPQGDEQSGELCGILPFIAFISFLFLLF